ncbi:Integrase core domain protein [Roseovarius gaetbuli]|uniref:Integrase core domain protein n=1 Tax=Roseovarius gaetbuli TaxID=1356575 RepID=A0A1X7A482_9RHOB|nr:Integrase core domain protein [Roseovarius gaetbuli]
MQEPEQCLRKFEPAETPSDLTRIFDEPNRQLNAPASRQRRNAIQYLRAAVAATSVFIALLNASQKAPFTGADQPASVWVGKPKTIRVDNGPEYISQALLDRAETHGIALAHIQPGQPQQNAYIERDNRTARHEWLDQYIINSIEDARHFATQWLWTYNNDRPNMGIGGITPAMKLKMAA